MESEFLAWLQHRVLRSPIAPLGLQDDAALLRLREPEGTVVTTDMLMDGTDFRLDEIDSRRAGRKALAVNLSDLAAMAARPLAALVSLALPRAGGRALAESLYEGMLPLAAELDVAIVGGDTNSWDGPLVISVTAIGEVGARGPLIRSGGQVGDWILVTGEFGGSILGKHLDFNPRVRESLHLHEAYELHAGMDVSDGLTLDLSRMAGASNCGAVLELSWIPVSPAAVRLAERSRDGLTHLDHALGDGEDFELLLAVPPAEARRILREQPLSVPITAIGQLVAEPGLWQETGETGRIPLPPQGYEHRLDS
jgi:thiamine-monophosphate kinase